MIVSASVSHSHCSMATLSLFSATHKGHETRMRTLIEENVCDEVAIVKTCNRYEIFMSVHSDVCEVRKGLALVFGNDAGIMKLREGERAVSHLFEVATTLDSMILGEHQILGQVKASYELAKQLDTIGNELGPLFERSIRAGKRVRNETDLCCGNISMASVAVSIAEDSFSSLEGKTALILGAGKISSMVAVILGSKKLSSILVTNRTLSKAHELARRTGARAVAYETFKDYITYADIVFCASSAPHSLISADDIERARGLRTDDMCIVDMALPPDVGGDVQHVKGIHYFGLEYIRDYTKRIEEQRQSHVPRARMIIDEEYEALMRYYNSRERNEIIKDISVHVESIRKNEFDKLMSSVYDDRYVIDAFSRALVKKTLHNLFANIQDSEVPIEDVERLRDLILNNSNHKNRRCE